MTEKREFQAVFQLSKLRIFEVRFYTLGNNPRPYFTTQAAEFQRGKRDYDRCGQAQKYVCSGFRAARRFYEKWDRCHLHDMTPAEYAEMRADLEALKDAYNFIVEEAPEGGKLTRNTFSFDRLAEWTKQAPKRAQGRRRA